MYKKKKIEEKRKRLKGLSEGRIGEEVLVSLERKMSSKAF